MKTLILLATALVLVSACASPVTTPGEPDYSVQGIADLMLLPAERTDLGLTTIGDGCQFEQYQTSESSPLAEYGMCNYTTSDDTEIIVEFKHFTNTNDRDGAYQYESSHLYGSEGLLSENTFGDMSRFRVNSEDDYGGNLGDQTVTYYHLWIAKDTYLIHITSKGTAGAQDTIAGIGTIIMSRYS